MRGIDGLLPIDVEEGKEYQAICQSLSKTENGLLVPNYFLLKKR